LATREKTFFDEKRMLLLILRYADASGQCNGYDSRLSEHGERAISPDMLIGDTFQVTVTGAPNSTVTSDHPAENGDPPAHFVQ
jgi:hypothetical protein